MKSIAVSPAANPARHPPYEELALSACARNNSAEEFSGVTERVFGVNHYNCNYVFPRLFRICGSWCAGLRRKNVRGSGERPG